MEFLHPCVFDEGEEELSSLSPRRLVGTAVGALCFVCSFRARTDEDCGIVINCHVVSSHLCGFEECRAVSHCVHCHRLNEANEVVCSSRFFIQDLEEERHHDLPDLREVGVGWLSIYRLELFERIGEFFHELLGRHCVRRA